MKDKRDIRGGLFQSVVNYIREKHGDKIDDAYEYFWEEEQPEEFLGGTALELAFMNFEDWLVCDFRDAETGSLIDAFIEESDLGGESKEALESLRDSVISLYEVVSSNGGKTLKDLVLGGEIHSSDHALDRLGVGDVFATRFIKVDGDHVMSRCVYPYNQRVKGKVFEYLDSIFGRYVKNKNPEGSKRQFLKEEGYAFNMIWVTTIFRGGSG